MNNVIAFPSKQFLQWGAIAQEIVASLRSIGATKAQASEVTERMRMKWQRSETPSTPAGGKLLHLFPEDPNRPQDHPAAPPYTFTTRQMHSMSLKTLITLARVEFHRLSFR